MADQGNLDFIAAVTSRLKAQQDALNALVSSRQSVGSAA